MAPEHVLLVAIEIDAMLEAEVIDGEAHRLCHDFIDRHRAAISQWLDSPMSVAEAADLVVERATG
jgi:hypothetical protein